MHHLAEGAEDADKAAGAKTESVRSPPASAFSSFSRRIAHHLVFFAANSRSYLLPSYSMPQRSAALSAVAPSHDINMSGTPISFSAIFAAITRAASARYPPLPNWIFPAYRIVMRRAQPMEAGIA